MMHKYKADDIYYFFDFIATTISLRTKPLPPSWQNSSDKSLTQSDAYLERIQYGVELFGKYFQYLW